MFSDKSNHTVYGDFKPLGEVETPAYYVHMIQKPESDGDTMNGEQWLMTNPKLYKWLFFGGELYNNCCSWYSRIILVAQRFWM